MHRASGEPWRNAAEIRNRWQRERGIHQIVCIQLPLGSYFTELTIESAPHLDPQSYALERWKIISTIFECKSLLRNFVTNKRIQWLFRKKKKEREKQKKKTAQTKITFLARSVSILVIGLFLFRVLCSPSFHRDAIKWEIVARKCSIE